MNRIEGKQDSPQRHSGHRDFKNPFFRAFLCGLCDSVVKVGLMRLNP